MPITPFHFGPGLAIHSATPRKVSFVAFALANVVIDVESGYNLLRGADHVHTFMHSYVGATLVILALMATYEALSRAAKAHAWPNIFRVWNLTKQQVLWGAAMGAYSHIVFDSIMHADMRPLEPFSSSNALLHVVPLDVLHTGCLVAGVMGVFILVARRLFGANGQDKR